MTRQDENPKQVVQYTLPLLEHFLGVFPTTELNIGLRQNWTIGAGQAVRTYGKKYIAFDFPEHVFLYSVDLGNLPIRPRRFYDVSQTATATQTNILGVNPSIPFQGGARNCYIAVASGAAPTINPPAQYLPIFVTCSDIPDESLILNNVHVWTYKPAALSDITCAIRLNRLLILGGAGTYNIGRYISESALNTYEQASQFIAGAFGATLNFRFRPDVEGSAATAYSINNFSLFDSRLQLQMNGNLMSAWLEY